MSDPREVTGADLHEAGRPAAPPNRDGDDVVLGYLPDQDGLQWRAPSRSAPTDQEVVVTERRDP